MLYGERKKGVRLVEERRERGRCNQSNETCPPKRRREIDVISFFLGDAGSPLREGRATSLPYDPPSSFFKHDKKGLVCEMIGDTRD